MSTAEMKQLLERMRNQRKRWLDLDDAGHRVQLIRPTDIEVARHLFKRDAGHLRVEPEDVVMFTVGWSGFTEADLLGSAVGSSDDVPFDSALWAEVMADRPDWMRKAAEELLGMVIERTEAKQSAEKN